MYCTSCAAKEGARIPAGATPVQLVLGNCAICRQDKEVAPQGAFDHGYRLSAAALREKLYKHHTTT
jgi:hypothetical protein